VSGRDNGDNAADRNRVEAKRDVSERHSEVSLAAWRESAALAACRKALWEVLVYCKTFNSVVDPEANMTFVNAGKQDVGHFIMAKIAEADPQRLFQMMTEAQQDEKRQKLEHKAAQRTAKEKSEAEDNS
jgi:hypothetical protein